MIFCEHIPDRCCVACEREFTALSSPEFLRTNQIFLRQHFCATISAGAKNLLRICTQAQCHYDPHQVFATYALKGWRRIPAILKRKCDVKLDRTMRQAWHSWAQLSIEHVCQKFWFSQNVTRCSCVSMKIGVFTFPRGPGYWGLFIICG